MKKVHILTPLILLTITLFTLSSCSKGLEPLKARSPEIEIHTGEESGTVKVLTDIKNNELFPFSFAKVQFLPAEGYTLTSFLILNAEIINQVSDSPEEVTVLIKTDSDPEVKIEAYFSSTTLSCSASEFFYDEEDTITIKVSSKPNNNCYVRMNGSDYTYKILNDSIQIPKNNMKIGKNEIYLWDNYYNSKASNILNINLSIKDLPKGYEPVTLKSVSSTSSYFSLKNTFGDRVYLNYFYENHPEEIKDYIMNNISSSTEVRIDFSNIPKPTEESGTLIIWINDPVLKLYSNKITIKKIET